MLGKVESLFAQQFAQLDGCVPGNALPDSYGAPSDKVFVQASS